MSFQVGSGKVEGPGFTLRNLLMMLIVNG